MIPIKPSENNSNWKCWRKQKLEEPENKEGFDTTEENLAEEITPTIPYNTSGIVKKPKFLVQTKINTTNTTNLTEIPADNNSRLTSNDVMIRVECPHRHQATNTTQISFLHPSEFTSEHPPPISDPDVQKNVFRLVPDNEHHNINDIQVEVECSQRQQAESTTMISPVQTSTTIPEHPPPTSESEVQKKVLRTISEGDITEDSKIGRQPPITRQSTENKDDHKPHEPTEESDITEKSIPDKEDNTEKKTTLSKDDNNQVFFEKVGLKPPKPKDNPKIKKITRKM